MGQKWWLNGGKTMGKPWENHGKTMAFRFPMDSKCWEVGLGIGFSNGVKCGCK
jgi:hypothetical protein